MMAVGCRWPNCGTGALPWQRETGTHEIIGTGSLLKRDPMIVNQATASPGKVKVEQANRRAQGNGRYLALACGPWGGGHQQRAIGTIYL